MLNVSKNGIVTINRGDNFTLTTQINIGTVFNPVIYHLSENDKVYFGLCECNQPFEHALIRKVFTNADQSEDGTISMKFIPDDTEFLVPDTYYYEIKLVKDIPLESGEEKASEVNTFIKRTKFIIVD